MCNFRRHRQFFEWYTNLFDFIVAFGTWKLTNWWTMDAQQTPIRMKKKKIGAQNENVNYYENLANKSRARKKKYFIRKWLMHNKAINSDIPGKTSKFIDWFDSFFGFLFHSFCFVFRNVLRSEHSIFVLVWRLLLYWNACENEIDHKDLVIDVFVFLFGLIDNCLITSFARNCNVQSHFVEQIALQSQ